MKKHLRIKRLLRNGIITIVISIIITALAYRFVGNAIITNLSESLAEIAVLGSKAVGNELKGRLDLVETIAAGYTVMDTNIPLDIKFAKLRKDCEREGFSMMAIADENGNSTTTDGANPFVGDRDYFLKAIAGEKNISDPIISRVDGNLVISYATPIFYNDGSKGVLFSVQPIEALSSVTDSVILGEYGSSYLVDGKGTIIAHKNRDYVKEKLNPLREWQERSYDKSVYEFFKDLSVSEKGGSQYILNGQKVYAGYSRISGTDWSFVISAPKDKVFKSIDRIYYFLVIILVLVLLSLIVVQIYISFLRKTIEDEKTFSGIAVETAKLIIVNMGSKGEIYDFNKHAQLKLGYKKEEVIGKVRLDNLICDEYKGQYAKLLKSLSDNTNPENFELALKSKDGEIFYILWNINIQHDLAGDNVEMIGMDITKRVNLEKRLVESHDELSSLYEELFASEETLRHQYDELLNNQDIIHNLAYYDSLTGLPNKSLLEDIFNSYIKESNTASALLLIDLDNFKYVNDTLGHKAGDNLLMRVAERINNMLNKEYWAGRFGGDEFIILIKGFSDISEIKLYAEKLLIAIESGFYLEGSPINISFSMGIAIYPEQGEDFNGLLKSADTAMNIGKETGRGKFVFFNQKMNDKITKNIALENSIRKGISNNEFMLYYQPQLELATGKVRGFEALVRWNSPEYGFMPAAKFIDVAESSGLILPLGKWVLREACNFLKFLRIKVFTNLKMAVNISILQLMQDDFVDMVIDTIRSEDVEPTFLELEITETILMEFLEQNMNKIKKLSKLGIGISLDDFGTGYSSLTYLRELPISVLKIDKSFIDKIASPDDGMAITGSVIAFAHQLGTKVVAEGVETVEQLDYLVKHNCDIAQGYYISRPVPGDKALDFCLEKEF